MTEDLGMIFIPEIGIIVKVHRNKKGEYIDVPKFGRCYLKGEAEKEA